MKKQQDEDILTTYLNALQNEQKAQAYLIETDPELSDEMTGLLQVVNLLWDMLKPVQTPEHFRAELGEQLVTEAERKRVQQALGIDKKQRTLSPAIWLVPVAALGTASLVGVYAYWRMTRQPVQEDAALAA